jgi:hypothetical protein
LHGDRDPGPVELRPVLDDLRSKVHYTVFLTMELARCPLTRDEWVRRMKEKGLIID